MVQMWIRKATGAVMVVGLVAGGAVSPTMAQARVERVPALKVVQVNPLLPCRLDKPLYRAKIPAGWAKKAHHVRIRYRLKHDGVTIKSKQSRGRTTVDLRFKRCPESLAAFHRLSVQARWTGSGLPWSPWSSTAIPRR